MSTNLQDPENNMKVGEFDNVTLDAIVSSIQYRIAVHREFIERDKNIIFENSQYPNVVEEVLERIKERNLKIEELKEWLKYSLGWEHPV